MDEPRHVRILRPLYRRGKGSDDLEMDPEHLAVTREKEQLAAASTLGVQEVVLLRHPDGELEDTGSFGERSSQPYDVSAPTYCFAQTPTVRNPTRTETTASPGRSPRTPLFPTRETPFIFRSSSRSRDSSPIRPGRSCSGLRTSLTRSLTSVRPWK